MASALAASEQAPLRLQKLNKKNIPAFSVTLSVSILMIGVLLNYLIPDRIFSYALTAIAWLMLGYWAVIALCHLNYVRGKSREKLFRGTFQLPGSPYANWFILLTILLVAVSFAINSSTRHVLYILVVWIGLLVAGYYGLIREEQFAGNFVKWLGLLFFLD
jgi:AAT family amino acid transporter/D-serine/D-alanine/glycine transporter